MFDRFSRQHGTGLGVASFAAVYLAEAHATDEWPAGQSVSTCPQPKSTDERLAAARSFVQLSGLRMPMLVDGVSNDFHHAYGAWPFRFYVLNRGILSVKAEPKPILWNEEYTYKLEELEEWLQQRAESMKFRAAAAAVSGSVTVELPPTPLAV
jgi:hypothetical protein